MSKFMLLLYNEPSVWDKLSPEEMQKATEKYMAWSKMPFTLDGKRLAEDPGRIIKADHGQARAADGPYSETKEVLGGYHTIEAASYDEAVKMALDHPHVQFGTIEVRHVYGT